MITALVGCNNPNHLTHYTCTQVEVVEVKGEMALVHARTAWHDTGWESPAERWVALCRLHNWNKNYQAITPAEGLAEFKQMVMA